MVVYVIYLVYITYLATKIIMYWVFQTIFIAQIIQSYYKDYKERIQDILNG